MDITNKELKEIKQKIINNKVKNIVKSKIDLPHIRIRPENAPIMRDTGGGLYIKHKDKAIIALSDNLDDELFIWVLFHEIGHHLLHGVGEGEKLKYDYYRENMEQIETQANQFADIMIDLMSTAFKLVSLAQEK